MRQKDGHKICLFVGIYGLGENTDEPGSREITNTSVAVGFMCTVSCRDAGFFLVPETKAVSNGILLAIRLFVIKLYSNIEI
ncbi:MAG: hypothetical protein FWC95_05675 [Defluviitaleaceae bacterium]|nr:hypothetical protein [Defluviitaleaceae bacterium]